MNVHRDQRSGQDDRAVEGEAAAGNEAIGFEQPAGIVLEEIEDPRADDAAQRRERPDRVQRVHVELALTQPACRGEAADQDPERDGEAVPGER